MLYDSILDTIGRTPVVRLNRLAPAHVTMYAKVESFNPGGSVKDRLALAIILDAEQQRRAEARPDRRRSDLRQHRHRAGDGVRGARLSVRRVDGRDVLGRAPQADARPRREGDPDAGRRARQRHGAQGRGTGEEARLVPRAPVREPGQPGLPPPAPPARRSCATSPASASTTSSPAGAPAARSPARARCSSSRARKCKIIATRAGRRGAAVGQGMEAAQDPGLDAGLRAGGAQSRRRRRDPAGTTTRRIAIPRARSRRRKASSAASPPAPRSPRRSRSRKGAAEGTVILAMLPDTGERYLSTPLFEGIRRLRRGRVSRRARCGVAGPVEGRTRDRKANDG